LYLPTAFAESRGQILRAAVRAHPLALLVTLNTSGLQASHLPLVHDPEPAPHGRLLGHLARANPQWCHLAPEVEALAVFAGPAAYVTPSWYAAKREHGKVVPTWNYVTVHGRGRLRVTHDPAELRALVERLTLHMEERRAEPWAVSDAPESFVAAHLKAIVGLEIELTSLVGKWKLSQNRPPADRAGVTAGLVGSQNSGDRAVAGLMADIEASRGA